MFYLQELLDDLAYGEFANVALSKSATTTIAPDKYPRVVSFLNAGLLDIYTRFPMKLKEFDLHQREGITRYYLRTDHVGDPNSGDPDTYIDGTGPDPVNNDIIQLEKAYDAQGNKIYLNDARFPNDITTPEQDIIHIVPGDILKVITIIYRASYPRILITTGFNPETIELKFPRFLKNALLYYMASRFFTGKMSQATEGQQSISGTFLYRYETELNTIKSNSLLSGITEEAEQFERSGWI